MKFCRKIEEYLQDDSGSFTGCFTKFFRMIHKHEHLKLGTHILKSCLRTCSEVGSNPETLHLEASSLQTISKNENYLNAGSRQEMGKLVTEAVELWTNQIWSFSSDTHGTSRDGLYGVSL